MAQLRSGITDGDHPNLDYGPFALCADEWTIFSAPTYCDPPVGPEGLRSWVAQCTIFGVMALSFGTKIAAMPRGQPNARELYLAQLIGSKAFEAARADLQKSVSSVLNGIDDADAKTEGIDPATILARSAGLLGNGTVANALLNIGAALDPILAATA